MGGYARSPQLLFLICFVRLYEPSRTNSIVYATCVGNRALSYGGCMRQSSLVFSRTRIDEGVNVEAQEGTTKEMLVVWDILTVSVLELIFRRIL